MLWPSRIGIIVAATVVSVCPLTAGSPSTLEDIYGDTGNTFRAAIGFLVKEGSSSNNKASQSYGLAVDDVAVEWREFTLEEDLTDCEQSGSCAVVELATNVVFEGQSVLTITVLDDSPSAENDCDLNGTPDATDDCNVNGVPDVVVEASSFAESPGEIVILDRVEGVGTGMFRGQVSVSTLGDSTGSLYIRQVGLEPPVVTVTYFDEDDGTGEVCRNHVDPAKHGVVQAFVTIVMSQVCDLTIVSPRITDNGDGDVFPDTGEIVDMQISHVNHCGFDLHNCTARIFTGDPEVDCIINSTIDLGDVPADGAMYLSTEAFRWKLRDDVERTSVDEDLHVSFNVTVTCDNLEALATPQSLLLPLDLDLDLGGQMPLAWEEGFESGTLGRFLPENLDSGIPGPFNSEGMINGQGWRCQYADPDWPNSNSYGDIGLETCHPGHTNAQSEAIFWQVDGSGLNTCDVGRAKSGMFSMYYGICLDGGRFTTPLQVVESVRTEDPINLGIGSAGATGTDLHLSWWQQISLVDGTFLSLMDTRAADGGVVQLKTVDLAGDDISDWTRLVPFQNTYDALAYDFYFNCMFDPVDDGNNEDDFYDPTDPARRTGPSSTCFPEFTFARLGDTDDSFAPSNIGRATTPPGVEDEPSLGVGTWVESRVDLSTFRGRRIKLRFLVTAIQASYPNHEEQFDEMLGQWYDDGWWIDDVRIDETLTDPAVFLIDNDLVLGCSGDPGIGCLVDQDCLDAGTVGPCDQPTPGCGPTCTSVDVAIITDPDTGGGPEAETLIAPGQPIEISAEDSSGTCVDGTLQYRFSIEDGKTLREWSDIPVLLDAPPADRDYLVEVRCSSDTSCADSTVVDVDVACPASGNLQQPFSETILAQDDKTSWAWDTTLGFDLVTGDVALVGDYGGALTSATGSSFADASTPVPGSGRYYVVRESGEFCNDTGLWTTEGPGESPLRESSLP